MFRRQLLILGLGLLVSGGVLVPCAWCQSPPPKADEASTTKELTSTEKLENEIFKLTKSNKDDRDPEVFKKIEKLRKEADEEWAKSRPVFEQQDPHTCGPACAKAVIKEATGKDIPEADLAKESLTDTGGTLTDPLVATLKNHGVEAKVKKYDSVKDLQKEVSPGKPAIAWVRLSGFEKHIVLIDDIWQAEDGTTLVRVRDPGGTTYTQTRREFDETFTGGAITTGGQPTTAPEGGVKDGGGAYLSPSQLKEFGFAMQGHGMGEMAVSCANPTAQPLTLRVCVGTSCAPDDADYQTMLVVGECELKVAPHGSAWRSLPLLASRTWLVGDAHAAGTTVPAVCTEFHKKVPRGTVTFQPGPCSDPHLLQLARFIAAEHLGGPWDQGAVWIVTDRLTREEMNKRLVPGLSPWTYLRALRMAGEQGGVDYKDPAWRPCLDPALLLDDKDTERDVLWFVGQADATALSAWVDANLPSLVALAGPQASEGAHKHIAAVVHALSTSPNESLRGVGARLQAALKT